MLRAFRYRFEPTGAQARQLARTFGCVRVVWNESLNARHRAWRVDGHSTTYAESDRNLTAMKKTERFAFLNEVSSVPLQQALRHQAVAYTNFFAKRARYPKRKNRHSKQSATYTRSGFRYRDGKLHLAKMVEPLDINWSRPLPEGAEPTSVTVARDKSGRWHVSILCEDATVGNLAPTGKSVGIDMGLKDFAVLSTGERIEHPKHYQSAEKRLARYQRRMARCQKGSKNRAKAKKKVARAHAKVADCRRDFLHKLSTRIVRENDVIAIEDLAVKNMVKNRKLSKAIGTSGWGEFRVQLAYKAEWYGRTLYIVDRFYPSSKTCSNCGHLLAKLDLGTRHWTCPDCGTRHDRDVNAAKNILAEGHSVAACGGPVRRARKRTLGPLKQEPVSSEGT